MSDVQPKVSVIMSVRNSAETLSEAIQSIINQTYTNWELIICNDASTDDTQCILDSFKEKFPDKIILLKNEKNMYLSYSLNRCLSVANGDYIARMDGDDISCENRFEKQIDFMLSHPEYDLVGTAMQRFNEDGPADIVFAPEKPDKFCMRSKTPFNHATIMTYKRVYDNLGGYTVSERTIRSQDRDLWFRFFASGFCGYNLPEALYLVREDMAAIKRRTFKVRYNAFKTTKIGFNMLGFPKRWLIKPAILLFVKSITPYSLIACYRRYQKSKDKKTAE